MGLVKEDRRRVMVVDASQHIRRLLRTLLGALEIHEVSEARDSDQASAQMAQARPDLIILDLPRDTTGPLLFVHRLRRGEFGAARIPVLALSASTHHAVLETAWETGIDDVIAKPLSAIDIIQRAGRLLENGADAPPCPVKAAE
jgi:CheY-like chemotaxis protein